MNHSEIIIIGIPVYKSSPTILELYSLERCCKVLGNYPFSIFTYKELDTNIYINKLKEYGIKYEINFFSKQYFMDVDGYNRLMVSPFFYEAFIKFRYLLIYQLDAFVFSDKIIEWCEKGYDYMGAPWFNVNWVNKNQVNKKLPLFTKSTFLFKLFKEKDGLVGNGGFSLRNVESFIKYSRIYGSYFLSLNFNEDVFWGKYVASKERSFKIPLFLEALSFSIENDPETSFTLLQNKLPFGCHAWYSSETKLNIWTEIFNKEGIELPVLM